MIDKASGNTVICTFRVIPETEPEFFALLKAHWPMLKRLKLVEETPPPVRYHATEQGRPLVVEIFTWRSSEAAASAHSHPEVSEMWNRIEDLVEERDGRPKWDFPHFTLLEL